MPYTRFCLSNSRNGYYLRDDNPWPHLPIRLIQQSWYTATQAGFFRLREFTISCCRNNNFNLGGSHTLTTVFLYILPQGQTPPLMNFAPNQVSTNLVIIFRPCEYLITTVRDVWNDNLASPNTPTSNPGSFNLTCTSEHDYAMDVGDQIFMSAYHYPLETGNVANIHSTFTMDFEFHV